MIRSLLCVSVIGLTMAGPLLAQSETPATQPAAATATAAPAAQPSGAQTWTSEGGVVVARTGASDVGAAPGDTVWVHYTGTLTNGAEFDSSHKYGKPIEFVLGGGQVIKGWEQGIAGMKVGEKRHLSIPPAMAYGVSGVRGLIPPNAQLEFDVELVGILTAAGKPTPKPADQQ